MKIHLVNVLCLVVASAALAAPAPEQQEVEEQTATLRGLKFQKPVTYKLMDRAKLREFLIEKAREQYPAGELRDLERTLAAMGLVPAGTDLLAALVSLYDEQVAAFYDPDTRTLCTFQDSQFTGNLDQMLLVHELTHALQDQNFDFQKFPLKVKDNDDRVLAAMAVIEGDATVLMTRWYLENLKTEAVLGDLGAMLRQNTVKLLAAPPYLRETLLFPYVRGQEFVMKLSAAGGTEAIDAALRKFPVSTEQILHPGNHDEPRDVKVPDFKQPGWRRIGNNVLGEFGIEVLLRETVGEFRAQLAATGWGGDRYHVYECGTNGPTGVLWVTEWDTPRDAEEFEDVYREMLLKRKMDAVIRREGDRVTVRQSSEKEFFAP